MLSLPRAEVGTAKMVNAAWRGIDDIMLNAHARLIALFSVSEGWSDGGVACKATGYGNGLDARAGSLLKLMLRVFSRSGV